MIAILVDLGWLRPQGTLATTWAVNPLLRERFAKMGKVERARRAEVHRMMIEAARCGGPHMAKIRGVSQTSFAGAREWEII